MELQKVLYDVLDKMEELRWGSQLDQNWLVLCGIITGNKEEVREILEPFGRTDNFSRERVLDLQRRAGYTLCYVH